MDTPLKSAIRQAITEATGEPFEIIDSQSTAGGCINEARTHSDGKRKYFVKVNTAENYEMFAAEAEALRAIAQTRTIRVPEVITLARSGPHAFLVLEAIDLGPRRSGDWARLGQQLANMHQHTSRNFGWHRNNTIGSTPQSNKEHHDWAEFFRDERLVPQFDLAAKNGFIFKKARKLLDSLPDKLGDHQPKPSLLHGDLWTGNAGFTRSGDPIIYDPTTYYGDHETDLAFSEFFGGFPPAFYRAYQSVTTLDAGYEERKHLYNLYHVLNHANLFGSSYAHQAENIIDQLV